MKNIDKIQKKIIKSVLSKMGFKKVKIEHSGYFVNVLTDDQGVSSVLIGQHGINISALQLLVKKMIYKKTNEIPQFTLDINSYRQNKIENLKQDIKESVDNVRLFKKSIALRPMSSYERRLVHLMLADEDDIITESIGNEPNRQVIIKLRNNSVFNQD